MVPYEDRILITKGRIWKWGWTSKESELHRVILLEDGETVHNVFFDRSFKETPQ